MLNVIIIMSVGIVIGIFVHKQVVIIQIVEKFTTYAIWLLLFLLGTSIGTNKVIVQNIGTLGIKAFILSFSAIAGSVIFAYFLYSYFFKNER